MKRKEILIVFPTFLLIVSSYLGIHYWWRNQYNTESFNCVDMSYSLAPVFQKLGFDTKIIYGINDESAHCWLSINGVYFDATSLWFNNEKSYTVNFIDSPPWGYQDELLRGEI